MKKFYVAALALAMSVSMVACGGSKPADAPATVETPVETKEETPAAETKEEAPAAEGDVEYTEAQLAVAEEFAAMCDRFNILGETISADEALASIQELVDTMNEVADAINEVDALFADPANLTDEVLGDITDAITQTTFFIDEVDAMVANYVGKQTVTVPVEIVNDTGVNIHELAMSPSNNENWGGNLLDAVLANGESGVSEMTFTEDGLVWDLLAADEEGNTLTFAGIDFSEISTDGAQLVLTVQDGEYVAAFAE